MNFILSLFDYFDVYFQTLTFYLPNVAGGFPPFFVLCVPMQVGRNWVASGEPLDHPVQTASDDLDRVSAGLYPLSHRGSPLSDAF